MSSYPKYKYHAEKESIVVKSEEHEKSLGNDWADSPADHGIETCPGENPDLSIAAKAKVKVKKVKQKDSEEKKSGE